MPEPNRCAASFAPFSRPHTPDGLAVQAVYSFFQDSLGFMWAGTQRGLFRFDSGNVRSFAPDPELPFAIPGKFVLALDQDHRGDIWAGLYDGGAARFDPRSERFHPVDLQPWNENDTVVRGFSATDDGRMWIATHGSLTAVDPETGSVAKFRHPEVNDAPLNAQNRFVRLLRLDERRLLVGTAAGLFLFDIFSESFRHIPYSRRGLVTRFGNGVVTLVRAGDGIIASTRDQLYRLSDDTERFDLIEPLLNVPGNEGYWVVESLVPDSVEGRLWVGTSNGLLRFDEREGSCSFFPPDDADPHTPYGLEIHALHRDRSGTLWVGTGAGISFLDLRYNFRYCRVGDGTGFTTTNALTLADDGRGGIWVGTPAGLFEYDLASGISVRHLLGEGNEQQRRDGNGIREIRKGKRDWWIGTMNGLFRWDPEERKVLEHFPPNFGAAAAESRREVLGPHIKGILEDGAGFIWSGSDTLGVQCYDPRTGAFRYYQKAREGQKEEKKGGLPHDTMMASLEDDRGRLWFGFVTCLARYDRATDTFERFVHDPADRRSLSSNMVLCLYQDGGGRIWVGTGSGLNRLVEGEDGRISFVRYGIRQGLPVDFIVSIIGHGDDLWLGTNRGILRFRETAAGAEARLYDTSDGLHDSEYALASAIRDGEGFLCFGGGGGFDRFHPDQVRPDTLPPPVVLTDFLLFNRSVPVIPQQEREAGLFALDCSITHMRELRLSYRHSVITFRYAALHFLQPEKIRYAYRLEGFDGDWIDAGSRTEVTYTNLDPGDYRFRVRAANSDGVWSAHPAVTDLRIDPPPWRTWWAHLLYGVAGAGAVASFTRWRIALRERELREQRRVEVAREEERENIRRQNAADFHDEAGTTLTRIMFLTELVRRRGADDPELKELLEKIDANAGRLSQGMRDFIWALDPDKDTLLDTLQRIEIAGQGLFASTTVLFSMRYNHQQAAGIVLDTNRRRQALMICKEGLHNALRHSGAAAVLVSVACDPRCVTLTIEDDGCGFDPEAAAVGYGLKSMRGRAASAGGELAIRSAPGTGTRITLKIPRMGD